MERPFPAYQGDDPYIFVCYAHDDAEVVYAEITRLRGEGLNIWYDEGISPGSTWRDEVALALTQCSVFLYYVTARSVASINCLNEVNFCLSRERKILSVHLEETELPLGLELSLSAMQAIFRADHTSEAYQTKLLASLKSLLPGIIEPTALSRVQPAETELDEQSIAILPLVNRNLDSADEYLCDGISEELISGLAKVGGLGVASQLSSFALKNQSLDVELIGEKLKVGHILSGSVQKAGNRLRINVLLSKVSDGKTLWSEHYNREMEDIFELQEDVARQVIDALKVAIGADQKAQLVDVGTENADAYDGLLLGKHEARKFTRQSLEQSITHYEHCAELDPSFGRVYWELYQCYSQLITQFGLPKEEMAPKGEEAINKAKEGAFVLPIPWIQARRDLYPETRPDQRTLALEACEKIRQPDPDWQSYEYLQLGNCLCAAGLFHGAFEYYEYYIDRAQHVGHVLMRHRLLLTRLGRFDKAIELWTERIASRPDDQLAICERAVLYSRTGQYERADQDLAELKKVLPRNFPQFYHLYWRRELDAAKGYFNWLKSRKNLPQLVKYWGSFLLGDIEGGISYVEDAISRGTDPAYLRLEVTRVLPHSISREVEQHPRYQAILKRFGID
ncbi:MAG: TIR domain-containing protein [Pseudomonadales bacterium]|nr:TIR domain-containing protein [Pseudomonadales bacterium]